MSYIGNKPTQGAITGGNIVDGSIESIDLATLTNIDINSGSIDGTIIGASSAAAGTFTSVDVTGTVSADGLTITAATPSIQMTDSDNNADSYIQATDGNLRFYADDGNEASNSIVTFSIDGSERARIDSSGNLGVGTSNPSWNISSYASLNSAIGSTASGGNGSAGFVSSIDNDTNVWFMGARKDSYGGSVGTERFNILRGTSNFLTVDTTGNVGIGTASPYDSKLHVTGKIRADGGTSGGYFFGSVDFDTGITAPTDGNLAFSTNGSERARIDSSGNFGIGTSNPAYKLVVSDEGGAGLEFIPQTSNNRVTLLSYDRANIAYRQVGIDASETLFYTNGTERVRVATNGNLLVGTTNSPSITHSLSVAGRIYSAGTYANNSGAGANLGVSSSGEIYRSTSSLRYKTDVQDAQHGLIEVMTLRPVTYRGINDGDTIFGGFIAEEVHDAGLTEFVEYNEDNEPDALAYANMVSLCIKAIQDQQEIIESLKTRIETLENTGA